MALPKPFASSLFRDVVLAFEDLVASELVRFKPYGSINACQERPIKSAINACCQDITLIQYKEHQLEKNKVNMAEGPSTTTTLSNQVIVTCSVRSRHMYKHIRSPCIGEPFETFFEEDDEHDKYTVAVHLNNYLTVVGHILRETLCTCHFFIKNKGEITGEVSGRRQCCTAACGGVEVPCLLTFYHRDIRVLRKAKELVTKKFVLV